jgi:tetratricopeptide (TPR) repeat protein
VSVFDEAVADIRKAIAVQPNNPDLNKALEINKQPEKIMFLIERGDVYYLMQKYPEAIADFGEIIKLDEWQLKEPMQRRIALAKQKLQENGNQPR